MPEHEFGTPIHTQGPSVGEPIDVTGAVALETFATAGVEREEDELRAIVMQLEGVSSAGRVRVVWVVAPYTAGCLAGALTSGVAEMGEEEAVAFSRGLVEYLDEDEDG